MGIGWKKRVRHVHLLVQSALSVLVAWGTSSSSQIYVRLHSSYASTIG
jgi:hypothetical protein